MLRRTKLLYTLCKETVAVWSESKTPRMGAALAYYTVFAITPLFLIVLSIASTWFGAEAARHELFGQLQGLLGEQGGKAIEAIISSASSQRNSGIWASAVAIVTLLTATSAVFVELQDSLNTIWQVKRRAGHGVWLFVKDRLLSFAMVVGVGFLLLVSLVLSAGLSAFGNYASGLFSGMHTFWSVMNFLISLAVITVLFAMILKILPDAQIKWRDVWLGGFITAVLFNVGKIALGIYLGHSSIASAYGAAGSLIVLLVWVYYSAQILLFGAEFTRVYTNHRRSNKPASHKQDGRARGTLFADNS